MASASDTHEQSLKIATVASIESLLQFVEDCEDATIDDIIDGLRYIISDAMMIDAVSRGL